MDPLSHALAGRLLIGIDRRARIGRGAGVAAVLGALAPDLDAVFMPIGWDLYLRVHQIGTHTVSGTLVLAALVATAVRLCTRDSRWPALALAAWLGALSHVAFDILSGATARPFWPWSDATVHYGLVAMAEPAVLVILVVAGLVFWRRPARRVNAAATGLVLLLFVLVGKGVLRAEARRLHQGVTSRDGVAAVVVEAEWGALSRWVVFDRTTDRVRRWAVDTARSTVIKEIDLPLATNTGPLVVATQARVVQNFLAAHEFPIAVVTDDEAAVAVRWSDLSYCWAPGAPGAVRAVVGSAVRPADLPIACGLWFGVLVNDDATIARQFVTIGGRRQER